MQPSFKRFPKPFTPISAVQQYTAKKLGNSAQQLYTLIKNISLVNNGGYEAEIAG